MLDWPCVRERSHVVACCCSLVCQEGKYGTNPSQGTTISFACARCLAQLCVALVRSVLSVPGGSLPVQAERDALLRLHQRHSRSVPGQRSVHGVREGHLLLPGRGPVPQLPSRHLLQHRRRRLHCLPLWIVQQHRRLVHLRALQGRPVRKQCVHRYFLPSASPLAHRSDDLFVLLICSGCVDCPEGKFSGAQSLECTQCPPGTSAPNRGSVECQSCSQGRYAAGNGTSTCAFVASPSAVI